jgi:hypothetical protein
MIPHLSERGLVLAPQGRDAPVAMTMLAEACLRDDAVRDVPQLV